MLSHTWSTSASLSRLPEVTMEYRSTPWASLCFAPASSSSVGNSG